VRREVAPAQSSAKRKTTLGFGMETAAETGRSKTNEPRTSARKIFMIGTAGLTVCLAVPQPRTSARKMFMIGTAGRAVTGGL
jgi:hypothetical protein